MLQRQETWLHGSSVMGAVQLGGLLALGVAPVPRCWPQKGHSSGRANLSSLGAAWGTTVSLQLTTSSSGEGPGGHPQLSLLLSLLVCACNLLYFIFNFYKECIPPVS